MLIPMINQKRFFLFILIFNGYALSAQQLTLSDAISIALKNNYQIQIEKNNLKISTINNNKGVAGALPFVSMNASDQESRVDVNQRLNSGTEISRSGAYANSLNANITGSITLYNGYKITATQQRLQALQQQSEQILNAQIQNTIAGVMLRYYSVIREQHYVSTIEKSIELVNKQLELVQSRKKIGLSNDAELFQSQIDLNTRTLELSTQQALVKQSQIELLNILDINPDSSMTISDSIFLNNDILLQDVLSSISKNPEITSLDHQIKINGLIEKEVASLRKPSLKLNTGYNLINNESTAGQLLLNRSYGPFVSMGLTVPIYNGSAFKRQQQTAAINTENAKLKKESSLNDQQAAATKTYQSYITSREQMKTQEQTLQLSKQLVDLTLKRYELNSATAVEVREAQKSYEDASFRMINLVYLAKVAEIELLRLSYQLK
jgi:outer membrane protein TolC